MAAQQPAIAGPGRPRLHGRAGGDQQRQEGPAHALRFAGGGGAGHAGHSVHGAGGPNGAWAWRQAVLQPCNNACWTCRPPWPACSCCVETDHVTHPPTAHSSLPTARGRSQGRRRGASAQLLRTRQRPPADLLPLPGCPRLQSIMRELTPGLSPLAPAASGLAARSASLTGAGASRELGEPPSSPFAAPGEQQWSQAGAAGAGGPGPSPRNASGPLLSGLNTARSDDMRHTTTTVTPTTMTPTSSNAGTAFAQTPRQSEPGMQLQQRQQQQQSELVGAARALEAHQAAAAAAAAPALAAAPASTPPRPAPAAAQAAPTPDSATSATAASSGRQPVFSSGGWSPSPSAMAAGGLQVSGISGWRSPSFAGALAGSTGKRFSPGMLLLFPPACRAVGTAGQDQGTARHAQGAECVPRSCECTPAACLLQGGRAACLPVPAQPPACRTLP
jgi:hypothetical protein